MGIINEIKKDIKKGEEALEKFVEKGEETVKEIVEEVEEEIGIKKKKTRKSSKSEKEPEGKELEKIAEEESTEKEKDLEQRKKELLEKAKKLREKVAVEEISSEELKEKVRVRKKELLIPLEEYVKAGIYLGTRVVTPNMKPFVYRRRADGLAIFNTDLIDEKIREGVEFLSRFAPEDVILACKREAGWRAAKKFSEVTGIRVFTKKYPAGILTNKQLPDFFESELTIVTDHWVDKNALNDTLKVKKKVLMICDTNNFSKGADKIIIGNNKSSKSLGLIFYLLASGYCKARGLSTDRIPDLEWWTSEEDLPEAVKETKKIVAEAGIMTPQEGFGV